MLQICIHSSDPVFSLCDISTYVFPWNLREPFQNQVYNLTLNTFFRSSLYLLFLPDSSQKSLLITFFYPQPIHRLSKHTNHVQFHDTHLLCVFTENICLPGPSPESLGYYYLTAQVLALGSPTSDSGRLILSA